jgi:CHAT domain-containing protein
MQLREERASLNQLYTKVDLPRSGGDAREMVRGADLHVAIRERELRVAGIARQLQQRAGSLLVQTLPYDVPRFQNAIGTHTAIIEYFSLDDELLAFVITDQGIEVVRGLGREAQCEASVAQFHFQLGAFQYGTTQLRAHLDQLADRACSHLQTLYDVLLRPLEHLLGSRRLLIIPHRSLHYVPFHALHDGNSYVIERCEVSYAPSLGVWRHCLSRPKRQLKHAVVLGVADSQAPRVRDEVMAITNHFPSSLVLLDEDASIAALQTYGPSADVLHMACHGQFRPDSPLFSALQLADGRLTVRDVYDLDLHCQLVVLSACETGMSQVAPGDELSGLARAFFSAGAASLVVSLWSVADEATAALMDHFYARLSSGDSAAAALRSAQCTLLDTYAHPFFWAPFVVLGRS